MSRHMGHGFNDLPLGGFPMAGGHRGLGAATPPQTANVGFGRHGSGARGPTSTSFGGPLGITPTTSQSPRRQRDDDGEGHSRGRERERDRSNSRPRQNPATVQQPQDDIEAIMHRLNHIDGILRKHGQGLANLEEQLSLVERAQAKQENSRLNLDDRMQDGGKNIAARIQSMSEAYDRKINELEQVVTQLVSGMQTMHAGVQQAQQAQQEYQYKTHVPSRSDSTVPLQEPGNAHFIGTQPPRQKPPSPEERTPSPWGHESFGPTQVQDAAAVNNGGFGGNGGSPNGPGGGPGGGGGGNPYGGPSGPSPYGGPGGGPGGAGGGGGPPPPGGGAIGAGAHNPRMGSSNNWHIERKTPKNLSPWDGKWESYKCFRDMVEDHLVACNPFWQGR